LPAVFSRDLLTRAGLFGWRRWDFGAHGSHPGTWAFRRQTGDVPEQS